jgi:HEAT repeat protein
MLASLASTDPAVWSEAVQALAVRAGRIGPRLVASLRHRDPLVRQGALRVFRLRPDPAIHRQVRELFFDKVEQVREEAVLLYGKLAPEGYVEHLLEVIERDLDPRVLRQALVRVGSSNDLAAVPRIIDMLDRWSEPYVVKKATDALRSLTGQRIRANTQEWRKWWQDRLAKEERKR